MTKHAQLIVLTLALTGCVDFGYAVGMAPTAEPTGGGTAGGGGGGGDSDGGSCTEGEAAPSETGPQVKFITLNVDIATLQIAPGDVVTWTNADSMVHSVVAGVPGAETPGTRGGFKSPEMAANGRWAFRFCTKRTAIYFCGNHAQQMNGYRIVVQ